MQTLPETGYFNAHQNPVKDLFTGRLVTQHAGALLFFDKGSKYNKLLYSLKYRGDKRVGRFLGKLIGWRIQQSGMQFDCIVPVPLHKRKLRKRGFNQSAVIASGISQVINTPVLNAVLQRNIYNPTQTHKSRYDRWENVVGIFSCTNSSAVKNKHVLLVDDVVTTGSTLESAGNELLAVEGVKVSVSTAAYASL